jgi:hypothetical protein
MIYLASPYTDKSSRVRAERVTVVTRACASLSLRHPRKVIFSPIIHCHPLDRMQAGKFDYRFWINWSAHMLDLADAMWVLMMPGWQTSRGIAAEIQQNIAANKPTLYINYQTLDIVDDVPQLL